MQKRKIRMVEGRPEKEEDEHKKETQFSCRSLPSPNVNLS